MAKAATKARKLTGTPASHGYSFPPEWARHTATWFSWPRPEGISFPGRYHVVPENLARIVGAITPRERVHINVPNENWEFIVRQQLAAYDCDAKNVRFFHIATNECWCRDHGPAFVVKRSRAGKKQMAIVDWGYNAWGGKYPPYDADDAVPQRIAEKLGLPYFQTPVVMEGGAVDFNGEGCVLTTESVLLNKNRNPHLSKRQVERSLREWYGQDKVLWLGDGIEGDDTDGHVDDLARFVDARTIVTAVEEDPRDANYKILQENLHRLQLLRDAKGRAFDIFAVPMPRAVVQDGQRLPATYLNFHFVNGALLVPTFRDKKHDKIALARLQRLMPKREVIGIDCAPLIWGLGAIHCLSQQQPAI